MLRIFVADDHEMVRKGIRDLVAGRPGWEICGEAADGRRALELALQLRPDVAILDISLPLMNGISIARQLAHERGKTRVLLYTMLDDDESVTNGLAAGARGYVLKTDTGESLIAAISALGANRPYFSPQVSEILLDAVNDRKRNRFESFTDRELEVAQLIAEGHSNKATARILGISIKTVESHRAAAMRKAGVHTAPELVRFAIKHKLIQP